MPTQTTFGRRTWNLDVMVAGARILPEILDARIRLVNFLGMDMAGMAPDVAPSPSRTAAAGRA